MASKTRILRTSDPLMCNKPVRRIRRLITTENFTLVTLLLRAIERVKTQTIFDRDPYESRRIAMKGSRLLKVLAFFQMLSDPGQREIERVVDASQEAQKILAGRVPRNTLSNALRHRDLDQMIEAWMMVLQYYGPYIKQMGKKYARIAAVDASLIKLSLAAFSSRDLSREDRRGQDHMRARLGQRRAGAIRLHRLGQSSRPEGDSGADLERGLDLLVRSRLFLIRPVDDIAQCRSAFRDSPQTWRGISDHPIKSNPECETAGRRSRHQIRLGGESARLGE